MTLARTQVLVLPEVGSRVEHAHAPHARGVVLSIDPIGIYWRARVFGDDGKTFLVDVSYLRVVSPRRRNWVLEVFALRWWRRHRARCRPGAGAA